MDFNAVQRGDAEMQQKAPVLLLKERFFFFFLGGGILWSFRFVFCLSFCFLLVLFCFGWWVIGQSEDFADSCGHE